MSESEDAWRSPLLHHMLAWHRPFLCRILNVPGTSTQYDAESAHDPLLVQELRQMAAALGGCAAAEARTPQVAIVANLEATDPVRELTLPQLSTLAAGFARIQPPAAMCDALVSEAAATLHQIANSAPQPNQHSQATILAARDILQCGAIRRGDPAPLHNALAEFMARFPLEALQRNDCLPTIATALLRPSTDVRLCLCFRLCL